MEKTHRKLNAIFALIVLGVTLATYVAVVAPTVSFWDCGEYAASCHTLEIPHPPGNPLYIMIGRTVSMSLFFVKDFAYRINLITVVMDAFVIMFIYLLIVRVLTGFMGIPDTRWKQITIYVGAVMGALFAAYGRTMLFDSVEAEVNGPQLLPIAINLWLGLVWAQSKDPKRDRLLLLITYLAFLGIGIHMYSMTVLAPMFLFVVLVDKQKLRDWRLWATAVACGIVMYDIPLFIWCGTGAVVVMGLGALMSVQNKAKWTFCFWFALLAIAGFSCNLYIPVRSALNPMIDENHPATLQAFNDYLGRKQYGSESMVQRMFWRRGTWAHQLGVEGNMGFGGFFITQFFHFSNLDMQNDGQGKPYIFTKDGTAAGCGKMLVYLIPVGFLLFGFYYLYKKYRNVAIFLILMELGTTIGLVLYMNFADGTKAEQRDYIAWAQHGKQGPVPVVHREVRVRDYFWAGGFLFQGMWIGISASCLMYFLFTNRRKFLRTTVAPVCAVLFAVSPALPFSQNVRDQSRWGNFVPFDYAYNLLMTCDREGILFTNGDNDTFPLWALQEAYGIRKDVRIVNLSLVNTDWYIKQLKDLDPKVPISFNHAQIEGLIHEQNPFTEPTPYTMPNAGIHIVIPGRQQQNALRVQDKMVLNIVDSNKWRRPVYFAVTVSDDNYMGLDPYLQMQGLAYRIMPVVVPQDQKVDVDRSVYLLDHVYRFRGLGDGTANLEETAQKLLSNYAACYIQVALTLRKPLMDLRDEIAALQKQLADTTKKASPGQTELLAGKRREYEQKLDLAVTKMDQCVALMPWDWRPRMLRQEFLANHNRAAEAEKRAREALSIDPDNVEYVKMLAQALDLEGKHQQANGMLKKIAESDPDPWNAYMTLARNYEELQQYDSALMVIEEFAQSHPGDKRAAELIARFQQLMKAAAPGGGVADTGKKQGFPIKVGPKG
jgi:tetratricopeptide (TPR) repeat protein